MTEDDPTRPRSVQHAPVRVASGPMDPEVGEPLERTVCQRCGEWWPCKAAR